MWGVLPTSLPRTEPQTASQHTAACTPPRQGWNCDLWDVLAPVRAVRPVNGGPGYDQELVLDLRTLNFELSD